MQKTHKNQLRAYMITKQIVIFMTLIILVVQSSKSFAKEEAAGGIVDDSIRDMTIVFGAGAAGAILGLSTLSFVDEPSKHTKNIAVGGAIGIVVGVAAVVFYQASKTTISQSDKILPLSSEQFASLSKKEFQEGLTIISEKNEALRILLPF